ncbi:hypothetical protein D3C81_773420 [compost metagenome]
MRCDRKIAIAGQARSHNGECRCIYEIDGRSQGAALVSGAAIWLEIHLPMRRIGSMESCGAANFIAAA